MFDRLGRMILNDIHSRLNRTRPSALVPVTSLGGLRAAVAGAERVIVAGGRHAMGGQQFVTGGTVLETRGMARVLGFDQERGLIEVEAGIQWPDLVDYLHRAQYDRRAQWGIAQKQTGANYFTIGGSVSANCHGRGLSMPPIAADVEALRLVLADGSLMTCDRRQNSELFSLVDGGYGLFGAIYSVTLRLAARTKLQRVVEICTAAEMLDALPERVAAGCRYGDFQFVTDPSSDDFLRRGVFSCYQPVDADQPIPGDQRALALRDWQNLLVLAHTDKTAAFDRYAEHYLATSGQLYWSDTQQLAVYLDDYHDALDRRLGGSPPGTEMISELYVSRHRLAEFLSAAAVQLRSDEADLIYGTVRFVRSDEDSFLTWASDDWACVVFNLHTPHTRTGVARSVRAFRHLIDLAIELGGSYYLTYHRWARAESLLACYPQFPEFLALKRRYDPAERFYSDWYADHRELSHAVRHRPSAAAQD